MKKEIRILQCHVAELTHILFSLACQWRYVVASLSAVIQFFIHKTYHIFFEEAWRNIIPCTSIHCLYWFSAFGVNRGQCLFCVWPLFIHKMEIPTSMCKLSHVYRNKGMHSCWLWGAHRKLGVFAGAEASGVCAPPMGKSWTGHTVFTKKTISPLVSSQGVPEECSSLLFW